MEEAEGGFVFAGRSMHLIFSYKVLPVSACMNLDGACSSGVDDLKINGFH